jgi:hypothetical protein
MPGVIHPPTRLTPDAFEMPKGDGDFHLRVRPALRGAHVWIPISISCVKLKVRLIHESSIPVGRSLIPFLANPYFCLGVDPIRYLENAQKSSLR